MELLTFEDPSPESRMAMARALLTPRKKADAAWPALAAALLFALSGFAFAYAALTAPVSDFKPVPEVKG